MRIPRHRRMWAATTATVTAVLLGLTLGACGTERSEANFCGTYQKDKHDYLTRFDAANQAAADEQDPLASLLMTTSNVADMLGSVDTIFKDLAKVAPPEIQTDVEQVSASIGKQLDAVNNGAGGGASGLFGGAITSLLIGLENQHSWQAVSDYIGAHCD